jgi:hypothetical protein
MLARFTKKHLQCLVAVAAVLTLFGVLIAPTAFARITVNTIDPAAAVSDSGRHIIVTGPISCTQGERAYLRVTVTQRSTGAVAEGHTRIACTGETEADVQQWKVHAVTHGKAGFEAGPATAVAVARTTDRGNTTDAHQWLVNITLVGD